MSAFEQIYWFTFFVNFITVFIISLGVLINEDNRTTRKWAARVFLLNPLTSAVAIVLWPAVVAVAILYLLFYIFRTAIDG